jgi:hypothetical protein
MIFSKTRFVPPKVKQQVENSLCRVTSGSIANGISGWAWYPSFTESVECAGKGRGFRLGESIVTIGLFELPLSMPKPEQKNSKAIAGCNLWVRKAAEALAGGADAETALEHLSKAKCVLEACPAPELTSEAAALLDEHEQKIRSQEMDSRARKSMLYEARHYGQTSSARLYTGSGKKPGFTKKPTVDEQLNEKPANETSNSSDEQQ